MVRSMVAAVAGLKTHQSKMDVIGKNIANVNTWGFKSYSFNFQDSMYTIACFLKKPFHRFIAAGVRPEIFRLCILICSQKIT